MWGTRRESQQQQGVRGLPGKTERHWRQFPKSKLCQVESGWYPGASISWLMLLVAQAAAPGTARQSGEHSQDSWVCGSTRWMAPRPGRCFFRGSFLKVGEGWSQFKTTISASSRIPHERRGFSSIASFSLWALQLPSDLSLCTCALTCQLSDFRFPSFASSQVSHPCASHTVLSWS